ncbi:MAG: phospho-N-acetylmuramoyl-pentapeptide-transferase [Bacteroidales bacterium]
MFYHLFEYLQQHTNFPGVGVMHYISVRAILANITALCFALFIGKKIIRLLQKNQIGEEIRNLGLEGQMQKKGTPTMGGLIIIFSILVPILLFGNLLNIYVQLLILTTVWLGAIGFMDDYLKLKKKNKEGLRGKYKIIGQVILGLIVGIVLYTNDNVVLLDEVHNKNLESSLMKTEQGYVPVHKSTLTTIPFIKKNEFDYSWLVPGNGKFTQTASWFVYILVIIFIITGVSNGANLTDGLDGLSAGISAIVGAVLGIFAYLSGHIGLAGYLNIMYIPMSGEIVVFLSCFLGALIGFLWYNAYPAQVFMGDTGSLMIGGVIAVAAIVIRKELLLPILCGIFLVESLSVIIQRLHFKHTKLKYGKGERVFKMAPLHHHFQTEGVDSKITKPAVAIHENKIVMRFWIIGILLAAATLITLKIR